MSITTFSSSVFNQDVSKAKRAAQNGPVFITERGNPSHVLLAFSEYKKITNKNKNIVEVISMSEEIDFELAKVNITIKPIEF